MLEFSATVREAKWAYKRNPHVYKTPKKFTFSGGDCLIYEEPDGTVNGYFFRNGSELTFTEPFSAFAGIDGGVYITVKQIEGHQFPRKTVYPTGLNAIVLANSDLYVSTEGIYTVLDYGEGRLRIFTEEDYATVSGGFGTNFATLQEVYNSSPTGDITVSSGIGGMSFTDGTNDPLTQIFNINNFAGDNVFAFTPQSFLVREQPAPPAPVAGFAQLFAQDVGGDTHLFGLDDAGNEFDLFNSSSSVEYEDVVFFGKHGAASNDGFDPNSPKDDIRDAIDAANLLPSTTSRKLVRGLDAGTYGGNNYNMTLDGDVDLDAPNATVQGRMVIRDNTKVRLHRLIDDGQGFPTINMNSGNNATYVEINEIDTTFTSTGGFAIRNAAADGVLIVSGEKLLIGENVVGAGDQTGSFGHIHLNFEDIYLFGDNSVALQSINSSASLIVIANHILKGDFTNTVAVNATDNGSEIFVTTNEIIADTAINVQNGARAYIKSAKIQGDITVGANSFLYIECSDHASGSLTIDPTSTVVGRIGNVVYGETTFEEFPFTPSLAPSLDYQVANKKYVDDEIGLMSTDLDIGTTPIINGTAGRILFEGAGNVLQEDGGLFWDNTKKDLIIRTRNVTGGSGFSLENDLGQEIASIRQLANSGAGAFLSLFNPAISTTTAQIQLSAQLSGQSWINMPGDLLIGKTGAAGTKLEVYAPDNGDGISVSNANGKQAELSSNIHGGIIELFDSSLTRTVLIAHNIDNYINIDQNFGFNTDSPESRLDVNGNIRLRNDTADTAVSDSFTMYSSDIVAGNASPHFKTENGTVISPYIHHQNIREGFSPLTIGATTTIDCGGLEMVRRTLSLTQNTILALSNLGTWTVLSLTVTNTSGSSWDVTLPSGDKAHPGQAGPFTVSNNEEIELNALYNGSYVTWTASAGPLETVA